MNCRTSRRLMHLDRPGERTERETADLKAHLQHCPDCSAEASKLGRFAELELRLRSTTVPGADLSDVKARVLAATIRPEPRSTFGQRAPQFAYALAVVAALAWFMGEQWQIRTLHASLVDRSANPATTAAGPQIVYTVDAQKARTLATREGSILPQIPARGDLEVPQASASRLIEQAPTYLLRTLVRHPDREAQISKALKALQSAVEVTIRFRPKGA